MESAAVVVIWNKGKFLALKRSKEASSFSGFWNFPGGGIEKGELPADAAARELEEEAGLITNPESLKLLGSYEFPDLKIHYFEASKFEGEVKINFESSDFRWVKPKEMLDMVFIPMPTDLLGKIIDK